MTRSRRSGSPPGAAAAIGRHGLSQEWIVDRKRWLPLRYRYVDHNRQGRYKVTNRLVIRFLRFDVVRG